MIKSAEIKKVFFLYFSGGNKTSHFWRRYAWNVAKSCFRGQLTKMFTNAICWSVGRNIYSGYKEIERRKHLSLNVWPLKFSRVPLVFHSCDLLSILFTDKQIHATHIRIWFWCRYSKCPKISNTKVSDKMTYANSAVLYQRSSLIRVYTVCHSTMYFQKQLHKKQNLGQNSTE